MTLKDLLAASVVMAGLTIGAVAQQYPAQQPQYPVQPQQPQYPQQQGQYPAQPQYSQQQGQYPQQQPQQGGEYAAPQYAPAPPLPGADAPPPQFPPDALDNLVQRIALYPDPLLAQVLTASTFWNVIPDAATWAQQHRYLQGDQLGAAVQADQLPWDPSILGLLAFPQVLDMMARDPGWTAQLGQAVLAERPMVMDAVQRQRALAYSYGYLRPNQYENVIYTDGYYQIVPLNPAFLYVPVYNPAVVFFRPRPGFFVGGAISFGPRIVVGGPFLSFGWWGGARFDWAGHGIFVDGRPWGRTWSNRVAYVHPYEHPWNRPAGGQRIESHDFHGGGEHREGGRPR